MYTGHLGPALAAKGLAPRVPLWVMILAAYALDVYGYGHEILRGAEPPYLDRHPLASGLVFALLAGGAYGLWRRDGHGALWVGAAAASHIVLDAVAYGKALWPGGPSAGVRLQRLPEWWIGVEVGLLAIGWWCYRRSLPAERRNAAAVWAVLVLPIVLAVVYGVFAETVAFWRPPWLPFL